MTDVSGMLGSVSIANHKRCYQCCGDPYVGYFMKVTCILYVLRSVEHVVYEDFIECTLQDKVSQGDKYVKITLLHPQSYVKCVVYLVFSIGSSK